MDDKKEIKAKKKSFFGMLMSMLFGERLGGKMTLMEEEQVQSPFKTIVREFFRRKLTIVGLIGFFSMLLASTIIPFFFPLNVSDTDIGQFNQPPSMNMMRIPRAIRGDIVMMSAGPGYGVGVTSDNVVHVWGTVNTVAAPLLNPPQPGRPIKHVSAGEYHALVVTEDGHVYVWGNESPAFEIANVPPEIQGRVVTATAGMRISVAITDDGQLHAWGGITLDRRDTAATGRVPRGAVPVQVEANSLTFGVLTDDGHVHVLIRTPRGIRDVPEEIQGRIIDLSMSDDNVIALLDDNTVVVWGNPINVDLYDIPAEIQGRVVNVNAGRGHFTVLLDNGSVVAWGRNEHGRTNVPNLSNVVSLEVAGDHNYAILADGSIQTWGLRGFPFGTDAQGRCVFTRLWHAGRYSLLIGMVAVMVQGTIGLLFGGLSGFYGGKVDMFLMRFAEVVSSLPFLPIALILNFRFRHVFGPIGGMMFLMAILGVLSWPGLMRLVRAQILQARGSEYVLAAQALGVKQLKLIFRHIMPNVASTAIVLLTLALATSMLTETAMSFIGFGVSEPTPTWGNMLNGANNSIVLRQQWWRWVFPAISLVTVAISINLIGDGLREATDPRAQGR
ncbi:MAG: ABC transporter permease subunit [Defluviitaleaceae bacterium]|nr:ABC transporter permease subunit [Defluviitaleaceae bacterium]